MDKFLKQYLLFIIVLMVLVLAFLSGVRYLVATTSYEQKRKDECAAYSEMMGIRTASVGYDCYVETSPGVWIDKDYYDIEQRNKWLMDDARKRLTPEQ
jgi:hypothetical protein